MTQTLELAQSRLLTPTGMGLSEIDQAFSRLMGPGVDFGDLYFQGFSSISVPLDRRGATLWFNDLAVGYFLKRSLPEEDQFISAIAPTFGGGAGGNADPGGLPAGALVAAGNGRIRHGHARQRHECESA